MSGLATKSGRLPQLDALRAFAVGAVMVEHYSGISDKIPIGAGKMGVGLFFVLSGFLITGILMKTKFDYGLNPNTMGAFYVRRFARLLPPYYAVIFILALLSIGGIENSWPWHAAYLSNVYSSLGGRENVFWTLAVEEQFYLAWPLLLVLIPVRFISKTAISLILICFALKVVLIGVGVGAYYRLLPFQLTLLGAGCLLAAISFRDGKPAQMDWFTGQVKIWLGCIAVVGVAAAAAIWFAFGWSSMWRTLFNDILIAPALVWLIAGAAQGLKDPLVGRVLNLKFLQYIGTISYGIYLIHNFIPDIIEKYTPLDGVAKLALTLALTITIASLSWRFFEKPIMRKAKDLSNSMERADAAPAKKV